MQTFQQLVHLCDQLLGPEGCPWDREQTLTSLQTYLLEEAHEVLEAIDLADPAKFREELGDLFYTLVFLAKLAEKEQLFTLDEVLAEVRQKLIRRHPHIFGEVKAASSSEVMERWEEVKKGEGKKSPIDGIPPTLPALSRAQKVIRKMRLAPKEEVCLSEEEIGERLWREVAQAEVSGVDAEGALRRACLKREKEHRR